MASKDFCDFCGKELKEDKDTFEVEISINGETLPVKEWQEKGQFCKYSLNKSRELCKKCATGTIVVFGGYLEKMEKEVK